MHLFLTSKPILITSPLSPFTYASLPTALSGQLIAPFVFTQELTLPPLTLALTDTP
jgi:hypothetical protein